MSAMHAMPETSTEQSLMARLKRETAPLHELAEHSPLQRALVAGRLPRERYGEHLAQMLHIHRPLEGALKELRQRDRRAAAIVADHVFREGALRADLAFLGVEEGACGPSEIAADFADWVRAALLNSPMSLLGALYVLEGSTNGSFFIAKAVRRAMHWQAGPGTLSLDPYGDQQRARWAEFKAAVDAESFSEAERDGIVAGAKHMFTVVTRLGESISIEPTPAT